jgi:hypothetical protein
MQALPPVDVPPYYQHPAYSHAAPSLRSGSGFSGTQIGLPGTPQVIRFWGGKQVI